MSLHKVASRCRDWFAGFRRGGPVGTMRRCEEIEVMNLTAREQIHRLVDALPDDALDTVKRVLAGLSEPTITHQAVLALGETPTGGRAIVVPADAAEKRLHSFFRQFKGGRSLADELIAERREEALRESSPSPALRG